MFKVNPNQKIITLRKAKSDKQNLYGIVNLEANRKALNLLPVNAYKIWVNIVLNQDGYTFALSNQFNMAKGTYDKAITELIDKGYLVCSENNQYTFYELPLDKNYPTSKEEVNPSLDKKYPTSLDKKYPTAGQKISNPLDSNYPRNITYNIDNNTINNTEQAASSSLDKKCPTMAPDDLLSIGTDYEAFAQASTDEEKLRALGF